MKHNSKKKTTVEIVQSIRNTWGEINPVTRVVPNKKKKPPKYKKKWEE